MVNYLELLSNWMQQPHLLLLGLIIVYVLAATVDYIMGTINAVFNKDVEFSSRVSQLGIIRKLATLSVLILVVPLALMLPFDVGVYSLTVLYVGVASSEIYSILGHIGLVKDGNKYKNVVGSLFEHLIGNVTKKKGVNVDDK